MKHIKLKNLSVGYNKKIIVNDINIEFNKGKMTCILGPNGSGKTTVLKTIARIIEKLDGVVSIGDNDLHSYKLNDLSKEMSVVLTNRLDLTNITGFEIASMGRYPHTGFFGILSESDIAFVNKCMEICSASYLKDMMFSQMSDGEKQKVMIARGLSQDPNVILLDEPTSHLDIKYKLEILTMLKNLCINDGKTVICTLHEPELAIKCCDYLVLVRDDKILAYGCTDSVIKSGKLDELYGFKDNQFNSEIGLVEFEASKSKNVFIIGSDENTPSIFRLLNRNKKGFGIGVLHKNDVNYHIAKTMNVENVSVDAYSVIDDFYIDKAYELALKYKKIIVSNFNVCSINEKNIELSKRLQKAGKNVIYLKDDNLADVLDC